MGKKKEHSEKHAGEGKKKIYEHRGFCWSDRYKQMERSLDYYIYIALKQLLTDAKSTKPEMKHDFPLESS